MKIALVHDWVATIGGVICFGKPCIRGTRIWVSLFLDLLTNGMSVEEILAEYPQLTEEDIRAAIAYGAEMTRERFIEIPMEMKYFVEEKWQQLEKRNSG